MRLCRLSVNADWTECCNRLGHNALGVGDLESLADDVYKYISVAAAEQAQHVSGCCRE